MNIEYIALEQLTSLEKNCKIHTAEQIRHIAYSIKSFGFNDPLGIWGPDNIVLEGNGRLEALKLLNMKEVPCVRLDHLNDEERRAYALAHNHINLETGFDEGALLCELQALQDSVDFEQLGIDQNNYLAQVETLQKNVLTPYKQVQYLISTALDQHDQLVPLLEQIRKIEGVIVESTLN